MLVLQDASPDASGTQSLRSFTASMQRKEQAAQSKESTVRQPPDRIFANTSAQEQAAALLCSFALVEGREPTTQLVANSSFCGVL